MTKLQLFKKSLHILSKIESKKSPKIIYLDALLLASLIRKNDEALANSLESLPQKRVWPFFQLYLILHDNPEDLNLNLLKKNLQEINKSLICMFDANEKQEYKEFMELNNVNK